MKHDSLILIGGTTLLYVVFVFIGQKGDVMVIRDILDSASIGRTSERHEIAEKVLSTYERAVLHRKPS
jgi:hypothetical protein